MSFIDRAREQLGKSIDLNSALLDSGNLNELLINNRVVNAESQQTSATVNMIRTSDNQTASEEDAVNPAIRIQNAPDPDYKIPVLYGRATFGGTLTDICRVTGTNEFQFVFTLAMSTGSTIDGTASSYELNGVYLNDQKINFNAAGQVAVNLEDVDGTLNTNYANKIGVYVFNNSSNHILPAGHEDQTQLDARNVFATWGPNHGMPGILFAIVRIIYDPDLGFDEIPQMTFDISNSLSLPGDVLYDYMSNTVYGCGIGDDYIKKTSI